MKIFIQNENNWFSMWTSLRTGSPSENCPTLELLEYTQMKKEKKKEEKKSQAKYRKEEKGKTYMKKHNKRVERKQKQRKKK